MVEAASQAGRRCIMSTGRVGGVAGVRGTRDSSVDANGTQGAPYAAQGL